MKKWGPRGQAIQNVVRSQQFHYTMHVNVYKSIAVAALNSSCFFSCSYFGVLYKSSVPFFTFSVSFFICSFSYGMSRTYCNVRLLHFIPSSKFRNMNLAYTYIHTHIFPYYTFIFFKLKNHKRKTERRIDEMNEIK